MKRWMAKILVFGFVIIITPQHIFSQTYGKIVGYVTDAANDEPLIGANVYLENVSLGAATDLDGSYVILKVPPGRYKIVAEYLGYRKVTLTDVKVMTDLTSTLNFKMEPETFEGEEIVVVAELPVIRKDLTSVETRVQAEDIERMAVQDIGDLLDLQPGVVKDAGGAIHIRGGRSSEVSFLVNGISITDDFSRTPSLQVENESIQELQVISGTFNAEYGNAMSGIINIVTKTGSDRFEADFDIWSGDYFSSRKKTFFNIDDVNPFADYNFQGSVSGPIIPGKVNFYATARRWYSDGWLYGAKAYLPDGNKSDSSAVAMNFKDRLSSQATVSWDIIPALKYKVDFFGYKEERKNYDRYFKLNPLGDRGDKELGYSIISKLTHTLSTKSYHELTFAYKFNELKSNLYKNFDDPRYTDPAFSGGLIITPDTVEVGSIGNTQFARGSTDNERFERNSSSKILKWELTSQFNKQNQVKTGIEGQFDEVYYFESNVFQKSGTGLFTFEPDLNIRQQLTRKPIKWAAYIQDKLEFESLIVNVGIRYDYFDAKGEIPKDLEDPNILNPIKLKNIYKDLNGDGTIGLDEKVESNKYTRAELESFWYKKSSVKTQISPRLGIAYPISNEGVLHFSYGIFQQIPQYGQLYIGDEINISEQGSNQGPYGNPDLEPQRTTMYEVGLQQQFSENISMDITGYYRDIRDWVTTSAPYETPTSGVTYVRYRNRDFANVRGVTLSLRKRFSDGYAFNMDYTFQLTEGTNSDPTQELNALRGGGEPTKILTPLNWDQRHTLNGNFYMGGDRWGTDIIARFNSGQPYTPEPAVQKKSGETVVSGLRDNSRNKPVRFTVDLNSYYNWTFNEYNVQLYFKVYNLLDSENPNDVYADTGEAGFTFAQTRNLDGVDPTWFIQPNFYSPPRRFVVGTRISFN
jgi:outer membrane receptor for ferrienterochelin and colicin